MSAPKIRPIAPPGPDEIPDQAQKGRGAVSNRPGRYEPGDRPREDDGWHWQDEEEAPKLKTTVTIDRTKSIIARNDSPDIAFDQSINPYRGCEHGCIYCFARPTHAYLGHSPGLDFESRLYMKPNAAKLLEAELAKPGYKPRVIAMGTNTDPYQPIERGHRITRQILEVLDAHNHPVGITTKSANVLRDADILGAMAQRGLAKVYISITTLDRELCRTMEPRASTPELRLKAIAGLKAAGVPVGVSVAPIIPALTDMEIEQIIERAAEAGAEWANWTLLRLPLEIKDLFVEWLNAHAPLKAEHVMNLVKDIHGGQIYRAEFGQRMTGSGAYADLIRQRVQMAAKRFNLNDRYRFDVDCTQFKVPKKPSPQGDLFDF
ncbi:MAG TPA: PA0069 family radical SAM protein [Candidatus Binatia bacterium]|nr:PA0069 family radical SAM protein [Candidatus Binatia bacterium]